MPLIEHSLPWLSQPQESAVARPEWVRCYSGGMAMQDAGQQGGATFNVGARSLDVGAAGLGLAINAGQDVTTGEIVPDISSGISVVLIAEKLANILGASDFIWGEAQTGTGAYNWGFYEPAGSPTNLQFYTHNGTTGAAAGATGQWATGQGPQVWVGTYGDGDANIRLYCNGVQVGFVAQTGNIQRNATALLRAAYWNGSTPNFRMYATAVANRRLSAAEVAERFGSVGTAWDALFEPRRLVVAAAAGQTITGTVGQATAAGHSATIALHSAIGCGVASASAQGHATGVVLHTSIAGGVGAAVAAGDAAGISTTTFIAAGVGAAAATGHQATVTAGTGTAIPCGSGAAEASGLAAAIGVGVTINCSAGSAAAAGHAAAIALRTAITANPAAASAQGHAVSVALHAVIAAGVGAASATGLPADVRTTTSITAGIGLGAAAGHQAAITVGNGTAVPCGTGAAAAAGLAAAIGIGTSIHCGAAVAAAAGHAAGIAPHTAIAGNVANATAQGLQAGIVLTTRVACQAGAAAAAGAWVSIESGVPPIVLSPSSRRVVVYPSLHRSVDAYPGT